MPMRKASSTETCMVSRKLSGSFAPASLAAHTVTPAERPPKKQTMSITKTKVAPTAARAALPAYRPTTRLSAELNSVCSQPVSTRGTAKRSRLPITLP